MPGTNLTREEATERASVVSTDHYVVELDLTQGTERFGSVTTVRFGAVPGSSTFADLVGGEIASITLNGTSLDPATYADSRIPLPDLQAENELRVEATCAYSHSGEGLHRFVDPADERVYLYTQFEVPDARRVFTTFEQPDLKATFDFRVTAPSHWAVVSNAPVAETVDGDGGVSTRVFETTKTMSTYITALVAGEYHGVTDVYSGEYGDIPLGVWCRQSLVEHLDAEGSDGAGLPTLRSLSYGGGKMPRPTIERALQLLPHTAFVNAYGLTETSSTVALLGPDDHREAMASEDPDVRARLGSAGRPLPTVEVSIRDEDGAEGAIGQPGEVWVRGEQVSGEYRGMAPRLTDDGWFPTHDGGLLDAHGFLHVTGRIDDVIVKGGQNVSPGEIEEVLVARDDVADVAAIGLPDRQWGERIVAAVVPADGMTPTAAELQDAVRAELRSNRTPDHVEFVDALPYNDTGKLLRRVLRADLAHLGDGSTT